MEVVHLNLKDALMPIKRKNYQKADRLIVAMLKAHPGYAEKTAVKPV